jgi:hypothetical protein
LPRSDGDEAPFNKPEVPGNSAEPSSASRFSRRDAASNERLNSNPNPRTSCP